MKPSSSIVLEDPQALTIVRDANENERQSIQMALTDCLSFSLGLVSFMDHTKHSLDSDSAVADTAGNIPSRASSSLRRRGPSRGSKPLPDRKKKKVGVNSWGRRNPTLLHLDYTGKRGSTVGVTKEKRIKKDNCIVSCADMRKVYFKGKCFLMWAWESIVKPRKLITLDISSIGFCFVRLAEGLKTAGTITAIRDWILLVPYLVCIDNGQVVNLYNIIIAKTIANGLKYSLDTRNWGQTNAAECKIEQKAFRANEMEHNKTKPMTGKELAKGNRGNQKLVIQEKQPQDKDLGKKITAAPSKHSYFQESMEASSTTSPLIYFPGILRPSTHLQQHKNIGETVE
ncbi:hypothetical protein GIB67_001320 [Kingdonia uniflora]|uniref:Uncharacterized protein n=1 Tax=Kingdonia uniflora TaxID=39325 RepID=A0A7J7LL46_9MAGN|nr:hypothetical protein GIB67_001320 [Kingdonia uniflora]